MTITASNKVMGRGRGWLGKWKPKPCLLRKEDVPTLHKISSNLGDEIAHDILVTEDVEKKSVTELTSDKRKCESNVDSNNNCEDGGLIDSISEVGLPVADIQIDEKASVDELIINDDSEIDELIINDDPEIDELIINDDPEIDVFVTPPRSLTSSPSGERVVSGQIPNAPLDKKCSLVGNGGVIGLDETNGNLDVNKTAIEDICDSLSELKISNNCSLLAELAEENACYNVNGVCDVETASQRDILLKAVYADEFVPSLYIPTDENDFIRCEYGESGHEEDGLYKCIDSHEEHVVLCVLNDVLLGLKEDPGIFDNIIENLTEHLANFVTQEETLKQVVNTIIGEAINEANFGFMVAKLSQHFDQWKSMELESGVNFRKVFFKRCQEEFVTVSKLCKDAETCRGNKDRISRTSLLFGELLCIMKIKDNINPLYKKVIETFIDMFLEVGVEEAIITLTKLLKLVGPELDTNRPKDIEALFEKVKDFYFDSKRSGGLSKCVKEDLWNVYKLHSRDWDRSTTPVISTVFKREKFIFHGDTVFTRQKSLERSTSCPSPVDWGEYYDGDDMDVYRNHMHTVDTSTFDDEEFDAFEEFLIATGQLE